MLQPLTLLTCHFLMHLLPRPGLFALYVHLLLGFGFVLLLPDHLVNHLGFHLLLVCLVVKHLLCLHLLFLGITDILSHLIAMCHFVVLYLLPLLGPFRFVEHCHLRLLQISLLHYDHFFSLFLHISLPLSYDFTSLLSRLIYLLIGPNFFLL